MVSGQAGIASSARTRRPITGDLIATAAAAADPRTRARAPRTGTVTAGTFHGRAEQGSRYDGRHCHGQRAPPPEQFQPAPRARRADQGRCLQRAEHDPGHVSGRAVGRRADRVDRKRRRSR